MASIRLTAQELECVFLSYDEPGADVQWENIRASFRKAHRVHGIKGIDRAHKACAKLAESERILIIDGDNTVNPNFLTQMVEYGAESDDEVLSWSALNNVNGLVYGNGGPKLWPRKLLLRVKSHEAAESPEWGVDFCHGVNYRPIPFCASYLWISGSPHQALRAGFREGVKFCLRGGARPYAKAQLIDDIPKGNLARLLIWSTIGRDVENGIWSLLGARLGMKMLYSDEIKARQINDYDWFLELWNHPELAPLHDFQGNFNVARADAKVRELGVWLNENLGLKLLELDGEELKFFRQLHVNPSRTPHLEY